jgi:hypothetical protein
MKASIFQKFGLALVLAFAPFLGGCDAGQSASAAPVDQPVAQVSDAQATPDSAPPDADAQAKDTNPISTADLSADTNADAALENASGKLISSPDTAGTNVSNNPQLTDFVKLVQAGVGESVLLAYVTNSASAFNVSSDDILYLNDLGTPEPVVSAMLAKDQQFNGNAATAPTITAPDTTAPTTTPDMYAGAGNVPPPSGADVNAAPVQTPPMIPSEAVEQEVQQSPNSSYTYFYDSLAPYGNWVYLDGYGPCWQPTVVVANAGWTPYADRGHWAYTDSGWCWVSDYSWGWAPFHYGRWFRNAHYGWCWAPDTVWGPAWVSWRYSDAYCGWAPLPPSACYRPGFGFSYYGRSVGFSFGFGIRANSFTFVGMNHFHDRNPGRFRVEHREVTKIYKTTVINNTIIRGNNNTLINRGVPVDRVSAATHQDIRPIRIHAQATGPRAPQLGRDGRSLAVYRPELPTPRPGRAPRLVGEGVKPAPDFNLRNRMEQNRARAVATRTPTGPYAPAVTRESRPIIGNRNQNANRPDNVVRDNRNDRFNQPNTEKPGSFIMRGANQPDRQTPVRNQTPALNQPDRGDNRDNRRVVTPPMTPGGQPIRNQDARQNPARDNQPSATRPELDQSQRQPRQQHDLQQQQQQQQRDLQQQRQVQQQQQRDLQQQQRQQIQPQQAPRQEAPSRSFDTPRVQQPPVRSEGTPRMQESRPAPEMRSAPQFSAPIPRSEGGGGRGGGGNGNNNNNNNGGGGGGRGR